MKSPHAFRSIGEVARLVGVATHVLRYWETQFPALAPVRRPDGRRYYRPDDLLLAAGLCEVLREEGLTIRGARRLVEMDKGAGLRERGQKRLEAALAPHAPETSGRTRRQADGSRRKSSPEARGKAVDRQLEGMIHDATPAHEHPPSTFDDSGGHADRAPAESANWLARLNAIATALRGSPVPLPPAAHALAQALRAAQARRS